MKIMVKFVVDGVEKYQMGYKDESSYNDKVRRVFSQHVEEVCRLLEQKRDPNDPEAWK